MQGKAPRAAIDGVWRIEWRAMVSTSSIWRDFKREFDALERLEGELFMGRRRSEMSLRAFCSDGGEHLESRDFFVSGGPTPRIQVEFEDIATRAAIALGCPPTERPVEFWVRSLYQDLLKSSTSEVFAFDAAGVIPDLIWSSASYCVRLAIRADEEAHRTTAVAIAGLGVPPTTVSTDNAPGEQRDHSVGVKGPIKDEYVELLDAILEHRHITLSTWAREQRIGRTSIFDWKSFRTRGDPMKGKVSPEKGEAIEAAIARDATKLGLSARTDSDSSPD